MYMMGRYASTWVCVCGVLDKLRLNLAGMLSLLEMAKCFKKVKYETRFTKQGNQEKISIDELISVSTNVCY
jgi:hypothetical protein